MSAPAGVNTLRTDFDLMRSVAAMTDTRNEEIRAMLHAFIGRMSSVPPSAWHGVAAMRFKDIMSRWNAETIKLHQALHTIAETIRHNAAVLQQASENHAHHITAASGHL
ncbi:ESAT-6-like protein EsxU [Mycobacterium botniense]|uniref:ESAT-6-like protein n=1 Tax=Mycobacterium botniense TaxID=84962 RepID=A0A7I9XST0_9MYCO|nr:ESAT-6-like protein EsxU [Mycobacterium botniense]